MKLIIRQAKPEDAQATLKLRLQLLKAYPDAFRTTLTETKKITVEKQRKLIQKLISQNNSTMLLAEIKGKLVGMVTCSGDNRFKIRHIGIVGGLGVLPKFCGQGIGTTLMKRLIYWAKKETPIERLELSVYSDNTETLEFYKRLGFAEEGIQRKASKKENGTYQDLVNLALFSPKSKD